MDGLKKKKGIRTNINKKYAYIYMCMAVMSFTKKNIHKELTPYHAQISFGVKEDFVFP